MPSVCGHGARTRPRSGTVGRGPGWPVPPSLGVCSAVSLGLGLGRGFVGKPQAWPQTEKSQGIRRVKVCVVPLPLHKLPGGVTGGWPTGPAHSPSGVALSPEAHSLPASPHPAFRKMLSPLVWKPPCPPQQHGFPGVSGPFVRRAALCITHLRVHHSPACRARRPATLFSQEIRPPNVPALSSKFRLSVNTLSGWNPEGLQRVPSAP